MALSDEITINNSAAAPKTFALVYRNEGGSLRREASADLSTPTLMAIKNATVGNKNTGIIDRHLISINQTLVNSLGEDRVVTTNFTMAVPRDAIVTEAVLDDHVAYVTAMIQSSYLDKIKKNES